MTVGIVGLGLIGGSLQKHFQIMMSINVLDLILTMRL